MESTGLPPNPPSYNQVIQVDAQVVRADLDIICTLTEKFRTLLAQGSRDGDIPEKVLAERLITVLTGTYGISQQAAGTPQVPATNNPCNPDEWDWDNWQNQCYEFVQDSYHKRKVEPKKILQLSQAFPETVFLQCRDVAVYLGAIPRGSANTYNHFFKLFDAYETKLTPITPWIKSCIEAGLLSRRLIEKIYALPSL